MSKKYEVEIRVGNGIKPFVTTRVVDAVSHHHAYRQAKVDSILNGTVLSTRKLKT